MAELTAWLSAVLTVASKASSILPMWVVLTESAMVDKMAVRTADLTAD